MSTHLKLSLRLSSCVQHKQPNCSDLTPFNISLLHFELLCGHTSFQPSDNLGTISNLIISSLIKKITSPPTCFFLWYSKIMSHWPLGKQTILRSRHMLAYFSQISSLEFLFQNSLISAQFSVPLALSIIFCLPEISPFLPIWYHPHFPSAC